MSWELPLALMVGLILLAMGIGLPVAFAFFLTNIVCIYLFFGGLVGVSQMVANFPSAVAVYALTPMPLFLIMGSLFFRSGLAAGVFGAIDLCIGNLRARLSYLVVLAGAVFAALSGSSLANTAMMGTAMVPDMLRRGYKPHMAYGPVLGAGGLAVIIPPSALAVLIGSLAQVNVGALLVAGAIPGLLLALSYMLLITLQARLDPQAAPHYDAPRSTLREKLLAIARNVVPMGVIVFLVVGTILLGIASPTESAALGCLGVVSLLLAYRRFRWAIVWDSLRDAMKVTGMTFLIISASSTYAQVLAFTGASAGFIQWALSFDLSPYAVLIAIAGVVLVLGMFMDQVSMMLVTLPIFLPLATSLQMDLVWFCLILLLLFEVGFTTPPFGLLLFIMLGIAPPGTSLRTVAMAALPYIGCALLVIALVIAFPQLALWLPRML
ncbi:TRAP transporter large permease [Ramlibacter rhizophilus]|uniref:TRAP transporter large permease protein n=1 Tax=Ramlibacter rhizophilus TaxID=1781167 RepID=A0A4Z0C2Y7_9BURK|nr:TRAP transporter large permease subunit [Ramlibacter rhizophilus]TFZ04559.1 TRAP transporter large permease subunit [Ramlibacter rhizophilus]